MGALPSEPKPVGRHPWCLTKEERAAIQATYDRTLKRAIAAVAVGDEVYAGVEKTLAPRRDKKNR